MAYDRIACIAKLHQRFRAFGRETAAREQCTDGVAEHALIPDRGKRRKGKAEKETEDQKLDLEHVRTLEAKIRIIYVIRHEGVDKLVPQLNQKGLLGRGAECKRHHAHSMSSFG